MTLQVERIRERTPRIIVDSGAVHLLSQKAGILTHATYWLEALRADEGTDFDDWVRHRELQVPDEVLCFIRQAGIQMSAQWQKLEVVKLPFSRGRPASLFLACRIRTSPWHVFGATFKQGLGPYIISLVKVESTCRNPCKCCTHVGTYLQSGQAHILLVDLKWS
jgi:hypothetical protein